MPMFFNFFKMKQKRTYNLLIYLRPLSVKGALEISRNPGPEIVALDAVTLPIEGSDILAHYGNIYGARLIGVLVLKDDDTRTLILQPT